MRGLPSAKLKRVRTSLTTAALRTPVCRTTCVSGSRAAHQMQCASSSSWSWSFSRESCGGGATALELPRRPTSSSGPTLTGSALFLMRMASSSGRSRLTVTVVRPRQRTAREPTARAMRRPSPVARGVASGVATAQGSVLAEDAIVLYFCVVKAVSRCGVSEFTALRAFITALDVLEKFFRTVMQELRT